MSKEELIDIALKKIQKLPEHKIKEVNDFIEFLLAKIDDNIINSGIEKLIEKNKSYTFLQEEPELYKLSDVKAKYK